MKIFYVVGYNSYTNKENKRVFKTKQAADNYSVGLTDSKIYMLTGKTIIDAVNKIL